MFLKWYLCSFQGTSNFFELHWIILKPSWLWTIWWPSRTHFSIDLISEHVYSYLRSQKHKRNDFLIELEDFYSSGSPKTQFWEFEEPEINFASGALLFILDGSKLIKLLLFMHKQCFWSDTSIVFMVLWISLEVPWIILKPCWLWTIWWPSRAHSSIDLISEHVYSYPRSEKHKRNGLPSELENFYSFEEPEINLWPEL